MAPWIAILVSWLAAVSPARLEVCPEHPHYFRHGDRHVVLVGVSDRALFWIWKNDKGFSWRRYIDDIAAHHLNYVRQDVCSWGGLREPLKYTAQLSSTAWPFARTGPGNATDGKPRFDLTRFDPSFFEKRFKPFLRETARRGIYVELTLFDDIKGRRFSDSLLADANNVNALGLHAGVATSDAALENPALLAVQHAYIDKVLAESAGFGHVMYEVANETGGRRWVAHVIDYIHGHSKHPRCLVSAGEQGSSFDPRAGANDIVIKHRGGGGVYAGRAGVASHHEALLKYRAGKPVIHNEYFLFVHGGTSDVNFPRMMMWADFTAGGHSNYFDFSSWRGTGKTLRDGHRSRAPPREILLGGRYLLDFLADNQVEFWTMEPHDELASVEGEGDPRIFTLARRGVESVSYILGRGPVTVTLHLTDASFLARWYDPKSGRFLGPERRLQGAPKQQLPSPAFAEDIVLHVRAVERTARPHSTMRSSLTLKRAVLLSR